MPKIRYVKFDWANATSTATKTGDATTPTTTTSTPITPTAAATSKNKSTKQPASPTTAPASKSKTKRPTKTRAPLTEAQKAHNLAQVRLPPISLFHNIKLTHSSPQVARSQIITAALSTLVRNIKADYPPPTGVRINDT